ncbi:T9SS type A sorting domain-containing protein [Bizionia sp.]|uniref:T9SS type A sorting domain-containing protein n=1 Tax=Bizionia sp. TaxID=1954480 RepID=UPI003A93236E
MNNLNILKLTFQQMKGRYLYLALILLVTGGLQAQNCLPSPNSPTAREIHFNYYNTNAIGLSTSTIIESAGGPNYTVNVYTFTIPYFQNQLQTDLRFRNQVNTCSWNAGSSPCGSKAVTVYNSHSGGSLLGSQPNQVDLNGHNFPVGVRNIRVEASCGGQVYQTRYYRFIVQKEATASVNLDVNAYCKKDKQGQNSGYIGFKASGTHTNSSKLYFRVVAPNGSSCSNNDYALNSLNTNSNPSGFFNCLSNGTYTIQLVYKSTLMGGGYITHVLNSNFYSYQKTFRSCMNRVSLPFYTLRTTQADSSGISIYPNPAIDQLELAYALKTRNAQAILHDMHSTPVKKLSLDGQKGSMTIDVSALKKGLYFLTIIDGDDTIIKKIVKK